MKVSQSLVQAFLEYSPKTGRLFWRHVDEKWFEDGKHSAERKCKTWNAQWAGSEAFLCIGSHGYREGCIMQVKELAHRVIWLHQYGAMPQRKIDHINGDRLDNRLSNLRLVTDQENAKNSAIPRTNTSGILGVGWHKQRRKWRAFITVDGRQKSLGLFEIKADAVLARKQAEKRFGFHQNHGRINE
jgi:hypothetical protein